jgi:hypothetical protein
LLHNVHPLRLLLSVSTGWLEARTCAFTPYAFNFFITNAFDALSECKQNYPAGPDNQLAGVAALWPNLSLLPEYFQAALK